MDPATATLPDGFVVRRAAPDDIPVLVGLRLEMDRELAGGWPPEREAAHREALAGHLEAVIPSGDLHVFVAQDSQGAIHSTASVRVVHRAPNPRSRRLGECQITAVYTEPAWRGRGLARAVVVACIGEARALGVRRVWLRYSAAGRGLYVGLGFRDPGNYLQLDLN